MRVPVVDVRGIPLMPCTPPKARALLKAGKAHPKRNKLGLFYLQLTYAQDPTNQTLVVGIDPGSKFEGFSVVGTKDTVCNLMAEAPDQVKGAVETRRTMRRARRQLHRLQAEKGGIRKPYGGTLSLGYKRGTLIRHPRYGLCTIGGCDRGKQRLSLHAYRTNQRLTQGAKPEECQRLTTLAFRSWLVPLMKNKRSA